MSVGSIVISESTSPVLGASSSLISPGGSPILLKGHVSRFHTRMNSSDDPAKDLGAVIYTKPPLSSSTKMINGIAKTISGLSGK